MRLYFIRHAATSLNASPCLQGRIDYELSSMGLSQAETLGNQFKDTVLNKLYCSPLKRAQQTAQAIQVHTGIPIITCDPLTEIDFGEWDGMKHYEIEQAYGDAFRNFYYHPSKYEFPGEKNLEAVKNRIVPAINKILEDNSENSSIAIVTHGGVLRVILLSLFDMDLSYYRNLVFDNASISIIDYEKGEFFIKLLNYSPCCISKLF